MNRQELNAEFAKAGPLLVVSANGSQRNALVRYLSIVAKEQGIQGPGSMGKAMAYVYDKYEAWARCQQQQVSLALYLNLEIPGKIGVTINSQTGTPETKS
jgi:hypothetical protein